MDIQDAAEDFKPDTAPAASAPAPAIDPKEVARNVTSELMNEIRREQQQSQAQTRVRKTDQVIAGMIEKGASEDGIRAVLDILRAYDEDREVERQQTHAVMSQEQFNNSLWGIAEESLEAFKDQVPGFSKAAPGLVKRISDLMKDDPDLKDALTRIKSGQYPTKGQWEKAANKAIDEYVEEIGAVRKRGPVEFKSSKPKPTTEDNFDAENGLDATERKLYLAYKNATGDEKTARKAVENMRRVTRGG